MKAASLNRRVSVTVIGVTSAVVFIAALAVWLITKSVLMDGVDRELMSRAERFRHFKPMASAEFWSNAFSIPEARRRIERGSPNESRRIVSVVVSYADGVELHRSSSLAPDADISVSLPINNETAKPTTKILSSGQAWRVYPMVLKPEERENEVINDIIIYPNKDTLSHTTIIPDINYSVTLLPSQLSTQGSGQEVEIVMSPTKFRIFNSEETDVIKNEKKKDKPKDQGVIAYVGLDLEQIDNELKRMAWVLAGLWCGATLLAFVTIRLVHPSVLRPARELATAISGMGPDDLTKRLPPQIGPTELQGVVSCLNGLFESLEHAFKREQATIANIAHELRTPVASLRTALEFRQMETTTEEESKAIRGYLDTVERMQAQVSNLLLLARLEAGKESLERSEINLGDLIDDAIERWQPRALARQQTIVVESQAAATCTTSPDHFSLVLDNLLSNAVAHGNSQGIIAIRILQEANYCFITVSNSYTGELDTKELGQAYYRGDSARSRDDHCGLGLALCHRLCRLLGAELTLSGTDGLFVACFRLPG